MINDRFTLRPEDFKGIRLVAKDGRVITPGCPRREVKIKMPLKKNSEENPQGSDC